MADPMVRVACALIEREGRLLVACRPAGKALAGKWEFPGGKIEPGESGPEALVREIQEELGLEIDVGAALPEVAHSYDGWSIRLLPFCCRVRHGEPHPREHSEVRWCRVEEIAALDLADADRPILDYWRSAERRCDP